MLTYAHTHSARVVGTLSGMKFVSHELLSQVSRGVKQMWALLSGASKTKKILKKNVGALQLFFLCVVSCGVEQMWARSSLVP